MAAGPSGGDDVRRLGHEGGNEIPRRRDRHPARDIWTSPRRAPARTRRHDPSGLRGPSGAPGEPRRDKASVCAAVKPRRRVRSPNHPGGTGESTQARLRAGGSRYVAHHDERDRALSEDGLHADSGVLGSPGDGSPILRASASSGTHSSARGPQPKAT